MDSTTDRTGHESTTPPPRWHSWDSPVGLGLFIALLAIAVAVVVLALR